MQFNTGTYMDGTKWSVPLTDVILNYQWTKDNVTLYMAIEPHLKYWVEVTELGENQRLIFVTGSGFKQTTMPLNDYLRKIHSLNVIK